MTTHEHEAGPELAGDLPGQAADATDTGRHAIRVTHGTDSALRVSVLGPSGQVDLVVPYGGTVGGLARAYAELLGLRTPPRLRLVTGRLLEDDAEVDDVLEQGSAVVAAPTDAGAAAAPDDSTSTGEGAAGPSQPHLGRTAVATLWAAGVAALGAAVLASRGLSLGGSAAWLPSAAAGLLLLGSLAVAVRVSLVGTGGRPGYLVAPALAASGGFVLGFSPGTGGVLVGLVAAGLAAAVVAAVARTGAEGEAEQVLRSWLVVAAVAAAVGVGGLFVGSSALGLATVVLGAAVTLTRLLPGLAVDVDDDVLLDLDRLAVTAWSARETPRGGRARHQVRMPMVQEVVARSRRTVTAGVLATATAATIAGPVVALGWGASRTPWAAWAGVAMVLLSAATLALVGRTFRSAWPRTVLAVTSCWLVVVGLVALTSRLEPTQLWWCFGVVAVVAPLVLVAAVQLGSGWRSVWWARLGEILETLTGVLVLALVPLASGLFDLVRTSFG